MGRRKTVGALRKGRMSSRNINSPVSSTLSNHHSEQITLSGRPVDITDNTQSALEPSDRSRIRALEEALDSIRNDMALIRGQVAGNRVRKDDGDTVAQGEAMASKSEAEQTVRHPSSGCRASADSGSKHRRKLRGTKRKHSPLSEPGEVSSEEEGLSHGHRGRSHIGSDTPSHTRRRLATADSIAQPRYPMPKPFLYLERPGCSTIEEKQEARSSMSFNEYMVGFTKLLTDKHKRRSCEKDALLNHLKEVCQDSCVKPWAAVRDWSQRTFDLVEKGDITWDSVAEIQADRTRIASADTNIVSPGVTTAPDDITEGQFQKEANNSNETPCPGVNGRTLHADTCDTEVSPLEDEDRMSSKILDSSKRSMSGSEKDKDNHEVQKDEGKDGDKIKPEEKTEKEETSKKNKQITARGLDRGQRILQMIKSERMKKYLADIYTEKRVSQRNADFKANESNMPPSTMATSSFGPIDDKEQQQEVVQILAKYLQDASGTNMPNMAYVFRVWLPEAIIEAMNRIMKKGWAYAEIMYMRDPRCLKEKKEPEEKLAASDKNIDLEDALKDKGIDLVKQQIIGTISPVGVS